MQAISYTDYNIGVIVDSLESLGLADNTVVIVFGDHGTHISLVFLSFNV